MIPVAGFVTVGQAGTVVVDTGQVDAAQRVEGMRLKGRLVKF